MKQEENKTLKEKIMNPSEMMSNPNAYRTYREEVVKKFIKDLKEEIKNSKVMLKKQIPFIWDIINKLSGFENE